MAGKYLVPLVVLACFCLKYGVNGDGFIKLRFLTYVNPDGLGDNGHCCDGKYGFCQSNGCDHKFTICLYSEPHLNKVNTDQCEYGIERTTAIQNQNNIEFGPVFGSVDNPMSFPIRGELPSRVFLNLDVWDDDDYFSDEYVEFLTSEISFAAYPSKERLHKSLEGRTTLDIEVWIECARSYYGRFCGTFCRTPSVEDNYVCDENTGEKRCNEGWTGDNCEFEVGMLEITETVEEVIIETTKPVEVVTPAPTAPSAYTDCDFWARRSSAYRTGVYGISVPGLPKFAVWCRISDGEGWTVIQRRNGDNTHMTNFYRNWASYKRGFGNIGSTASEFWMGLEKIHKLTTLKKFALHISMFTGDGEWKWARYDRFWIDSEAEGYRLHIEGYSGNAGDALNYLGLNGTRNHNGQAFSTFDKDADGWQDGSCARLYRAGWWFNDCEWSNLNGVYLRPGEDEGPPHCTFTRCISWKTIEGYEFYSLLGTEMSIRPNPRDQ